MAYMDIEKMGMVNY